MKCSECKFCETFSETDNTGSCTYYSSHRPLMIPRVISGPEEYFPEALWIEDCNEEFTNCYCFVDVSNPEGI